MEKSLKYNRIREVLESRGIKQTWLAEQLNKTYRQVNAYITNTAQPPLPILFEIARILEVSPRELISEESLEPLETTATKR